MRRRWWGTRCGCATAGYLSDDLLGLDGKYTRLVQQQLCRLGADVSFAKVREHGWALRELTRNRHSLEDIYVQVTRPEEEES